MGKVKSGAKAVFLGRFALGWGERLGEDGGVSNDRGLNERCHDPKLAG